jgi:hypothetical protein
MGTRILFAGGWLLPDPDADIRRAPTTDLVDMYDSATSDVQDKP